MISQTINTPQLFQQLINNKQSLFIMVSFMNFDDVKALQIAVKNNKAVKINKEIDRLLTTFVFNKQYINKIDRTIAYFMYENNFVQQHDNTSILNIAQNSTLEVQHIMNSYQSLFTSLKQRCNMAQQEVNALTRIITQPDLPLPSSIRSHIGKYCNSNFQLFLCAKATNTQSFFSPQSEFQQFKTHILDNQDNYLIDILSSSQHHEMQQSFSLVQKIKQLCHNPEAFVQNLSNDSEEYSEKNEVFNFFVIMIKLAKNMAKSIKLRLQSVSYDPYVYFTELILRYSLYKFSMLELEESFGPIFTSFESIVRQALNITKVRHQVQQISLWKVMMGIFRTELEHEMKNAIPVYINLVHKLKVAQNNGLYQKLGINEEKQNVSQFFQQHEGSPVLEYLMNQQNVDNAPVYMTDFVQMLIDLSVDQYNVLLCGHSDQFLGGIYEQWEEAFIAYENQIFDQLTSSSQFTFPDQEKYLIESQIQLMTKKLNIKPKTIKYFLDRINNDKVEINFESVDRQLTEINKKYFGQSYELHNSQKSHKSSLTADDSDKEEEIDLEGLEYFSQIDEEQIIEQIDV